LLEEAGFETSWSINILEWGFSDLGLFYYSAYCIFESSHRELNSKTMSTAPNQQENLQSDAKPEDPSPDRPEEEEEEGECGFCLFMKGGGCKDTFIDWENCVKEAEDKKEDLVEKCSQITARLKQCMDSYSDYYAPILMAEKHAEEKAVIEFEKEKQDSAANDSASQSNQK
jgi:hypothetical protein